MEDLFLKSRDELVQIAKDLGLSFHHKLGSEKLIELINSSFEPGPVEQQEVKEQETEEIFEKKQGAKGKGPSRFNKFGGNQ